MTSWEINDKTVDSIHFNNLEVSQIIIDDKIIYEKESGTIDNIQLTSTKNILSHYDEETTTLTAQISSLNNAKLSNKNITFEAYKTKDDTLIETLNANTDNNGIATITYDSKGTGDIYIKAIYESLSDTVSIEDCVRTFTNEISAINGDNVATNISSDFILTVDYYPNDSWEWLRIKLFDAVQGVFSSSYDKGSNFGLTDLGYNGWKSIIVKLEDNTLTFQYSSKTASKTITSAYPSDLIMNVNRNNNKIRNYKLKAL